VGCMRKEDRDRCLNQANTLMSLSGAFRGTGSMSAGVTSRVPASSPNLRPTTGAKACSLDTSAKGSTAKFGSMG
jgi:hypothetical protein